MALIKCKECGNGLSDTAKVCPICGFNQNKENKKENLRVLKSNITNRIVKLKEKCRKHKRLVLVVVIAVFIIIAYMIYSNNFFEAYNKAKKYSIKNKYTFAYNEIREFPIILGDEEVREEISYMKLKAELGWDRENAESYADYLSYEEQDKWISYAIGALYSGLEKSINYQPKNDKEKAIKNEFITFYYYNLYINLPRRYIEEEFIKEVNELNYSEFTEKMEDIEKNSKKIKTSWFRVQDPLDYYSDFEKYLFDSNLEFHYPKIEYDLNYNYLTNLYK